MSSANRIKRGNMLALVDHEISIDAVRFAHHILPAAVAPAYAGTSLRGAQRRGNPEELA